MLCMAAQGDPKGYLAVGETALDERDVARIVGVTSKEAELLIAELARNGVFARDAAGRIYSRRMVRDAARSLSARRNGARGGNPKLITARRQAATDIHVVEAAAPVADNPSDKPTVDPAH